MFGFIRRLARPFGMLGEKIAEVLNIGRKIPAGVVKEKVLVDNIPFKYTKIPKFMEGGGSTGLPAGKYLRPYDQMNSSGAFTGFTPSYIGN